jgi:hypothetical protein
MLVGRFVAAGRNSYGSVGELNGGEIRMWGYFLATRSRQNEVAKVVKILRRFEQSFAEPLRPLHF